MTAFAQILAGLVAWQGLNAWWIAYDWFDMAWALFRFGLHAGLAAALLASAVSVYGGPEPDERLSRWGERLVVIYAAYAVFDTVILLVHGRYRDIPNLEFLVPALGVFVFCLLRLQRGVVEAFAVGGLFAKRKSGQGFDLARTFTWWLWASVVMAPLSEAVALAQGTDFINSHPRFSDQAPLLLASLFTNHQMLIWSGMLILLSLPFAAEWRLRRQTLVVSDL